MNKTITVNLNGSIFTLDDDAYQVLKNYFAELEAHFANEDGKQEIIDDIEARIAEHLKQKILISQQAISLFIINEVIEIMGRPGQIDGNGEPENSNKSYKSDYSCNRMYRDVDEKMLGGVCSGIGYYWSIEPLLLRVFFIISSFWGGFGVVLYIILWIVIPPAETKAQKLEMRGKPVNAENIGKNFDNNK